MRSLKWIALAVWTLPALVPAPQANGGSAWEKPISPGVVYRMEVDPLAPRQTHAIRLSPLSSENKLSVELAGITIDEEGPTKGRATPTEMAAQIGAIAVINGDFFAADHGAPIGMMVKDGVLVTTPARERSAFAWGARDTAVGLGRSSATITPQGQLPVKLTGVNQPIGDNGLVLYTSNFGKLIPRRPKNLLISVSIPGDEVIPNGTITTTVDAIFADSGPIKVEPGKAVILANGTSIAQVSAIKAGQRVTIKTEAPGFDWSLFDNMISGGPMLLKDGKVAINSVEEGFNDAFTKNRHPRTAIGKTLDGDVWIVVIDGRQKLSIGATLEETAAVMRRLGCVDAVNLDGGGSSALHLSGVTVNRPSDGRERAVSNGIAIYGPRAPVTPNLFPAPPKPAPLKLVVPTKLALDGVYEVRVEQNGSLVPHADVLWTSRGAGWVDQGGQLRITDIGKGSVIARVQGQTLSTNFEVPAKTGQTNQKPPTVVK